MFMLAGAAMLLSSFTGLNTWVLITVVSIAVLVPLVYSLLLYRKLYGFGSGEP